jgi:hypothetical protein
MMVEPIPEAAAMQQQLTVLHQSLSGKGQANTDATIQE